MNSLTQKLQYLSFRLERIGGDELAAAAALVSAAALLDHMHPEVEHALFNDLWGHVTRALDHEDFELSYLNEVSSLESEIAGHVLSYRLARGWLVRANDAPMEFQNFSERLDQLCKRVGY